MGAGRVLTGMAVNQAAAVSGSNSLSLARIADRQHFPLVAVRFVPVDDAAPVLRVNLVVDRPMNVAAVRYSSRLDTPENGVEVILR